MYMCVFPTYLHEKQYRDLPTINVNPVYLHAFVHVHMYLYMRAHLQAYVNKGILAMDIFYPQKRAFEKNCFGQQLFHSLPLYVVWDIAV